MQGPPFLRTSKGLHLLIADTAHNERQETGLKWYADRHIGLECIAVLGEFWA